VGDLKINGVGVGASDTGGLKDKVEAINKVSDQTGVTADVFTSVSLDFGSVSLSTLVGGDVGVNGVDIAIPAGGATTTLADVAQAFNDETDATGITATVSGTRVILEGNVSQIAFGPNAAGTTTAVTAALTDGAANTVQFAEAGDESSAAAITDTATAAGGIQLKSNNGTAISVEHKDTAAEAKTGMVDSNIKAGGSFGTAIANISIATQSGAQKAIDVIDNALESVNDIRSELGAVSNRLDFTVSNLSNVVENSSAARSRIMDADFAAESANLSRAQVLQQASQAMLAQANARPQQVLSLLQ
jgi:flagellin